MLVEEGVSIDLSATGGSVTEFGRVQGSKRGQPVQEREFVYLWVREVAGFDRTDPSQLERGLVTVCRRFSNRT